MRPDSELPQELQEQQPQQEQPQQELQPQEQPLRERQLVPAPGWLALPQPVPKGLLPQGRQCHRPDCCRRCLP